MDEVIAQIQARWTAYLVIFIILLPILYVARKQMMPVVLWTIECAIYATILHVVIHYFVGILRWFVGEATFRAVHDEKIDTGWHTPLDTFWKRELYIPQWVFYLELVTVIAIVVLVIRYRPHRYKNMRDRMKDTDSKKRNYTPPRPKTGAYR